VPPDNVLQIRAANKADLIDLGALRLFRDLPGLSA